MSNRQIGNKCREISEMLLVKLDGKRVYENEDFSTEQYKHCMSVKEKLLEIHRDIVNIMKGTFEVRNIHVQCITTTGLVVVHVHVHVY